MSGDRYRAPHTTSYPVAPRESRRLGQGGNLWVPIGAEFHRGPSAKHKSTGRRMVPVTGDASQPGGSSRMWRPRGARLESFSLPGSKATLHTKARQELRGINAAWSRHMTVAQRITHEDDEDSLVLKAAQLCFCYRQIFCQNQHMVCSSFDACKYANGRVLISPAPFLDFAFDWPCLAEAAPAFPPGLKRQSSFSRRCGISTQAPPARSAFSFSIAYSHPHRSCSE